MRHFTRKAGRFFLLPLMPATALALNCLLAGCQGGATSAGDALLRSVSNPSPGDDAVDARLALLAHRKRRPPKPPLPPQIPVAQPVPPETAVQAAALRRAQQQAAALRRAQQQAAAWATHGLTGAMKPVSSGSGIVVCEPIVPASAAALAAFGAGCGRWLHLAVGGQGELGKTPLWGLVDDARRELGKSDLRLDSHDVVPLARMLGVTHVATGRLEGDAARCTLVYQLWTADGKAAGAPLPVTGSPQQVLAQLPALARRIWQRLGVAAPRVPAMVGATPAELTLLGQVPWKARTAIDEAPARQLQALAGRWPLAAGRGTADMQPYPR